MKHVHPTPAREKTFCARKLPQWPSPAPHSGHDVVWYQILHWLAQMVLLGVALPSL